MRTDSSRRLGDLRSSSLPSVWRRDRRGRRPRPPTASATAGILTATSARTATDVWSAGYAQAADSTITPLGRALGRHGLEATPTPFPAGRSHGQLKG